MPDIPHLAYPMRLAVNGDFAEVEQDSLQDVRQCVHVLLRTPLGGRPLAPQSGVEDPTFTTVDPDALAAILEGQEDRAAVTVTVWPVAEGGEQQLEVGVALAAGDVDDKEPTA